MSHGNDDPPTPTPPNGHGPPGQRPVSVPGGEIGARLRDVEARLVDLDARDMAQHGEVVARLDALTRSTEDVGGKLVAGLAALEEAHRQRVTLRLLEIAEEGIRRALTPAAAPIYAIALLVGAVGLAGASFSYNGLRVVADRAAANADSDDEGGDMPASVSGGMGQPEPSP